ncbi:MAG: hypothetical protein COA65_05170 [Rhodospirillaceae bacterium]|nr:MAG: hypothetical protein COA65_05170 [Rhodospirillaceae bacterium]
MAKTTEGLGALAQDVDDFLFRLAFHDPKKMAALRREAIEKWVPNFTTLKTHADKMPDANLVHAFAAFEAAMTGFGEAESHAFTDIIEHKLRVDAANVLLKKAIFAREYNGEVFEEGDEAFYLPSHETASQRALLVVLHGAFMKGRHFIWKWVFAAARRKIPIYAPSSQRESWTEDDLEWIESMVAKLGENYDLPKEACRVAGLSDGALAALTLCRRKNIPFCKAAFLAGMRPFDVEAMPKIPVYVIHGTDDPIFPGMSVRKMAESLRAHAPEVIYRELEGAPHSFPYPEIDALMDWFLEAHANAPSG